MSTRKPAVANHFYPGDKNLLETTVNKLFNNSHGPTFMWWRRAVKELVDSCLKQVFVTWVEMIRYSSSPPHKSGAMGVISPHAGYVYSGGVCAETLKGIDIPETVVILGPKHQARGAAVALSTADWQLPAGTVRVDKQLSELLISHSPEIQIDELAHLHEHSLEVQVPFLQRLREDVKIVPLVLSHLSFALCEKLGLALSSAIEHYGKKVLVLASSDMSHYESRASASQKDRLALAHVENLDPKGLYQTVLDNRISMCGIVPVTVMLICSIQLGSNRAELVRYTDSGDVSGDTDQVVGYAGAVIRKV